MGRFNKRAGNHRILVANQVLAAKDAKLAGLTEEQIEEEANARASEYLQRGVRDKLLKTQSHVSQAEKHLQVKVVKSSHFFFASRPWPINPLSSPQVAKRELTSILCDENWSPEESLRLLCGEGGGKKSAFRVALDSLIAGAVNTTDNTVDDDVSTLVDAMEVAGPSAALAAEFAAPSPALPYNRSTHPC